VRASRLRLPVLLGVVAVVGLAVVHRGEIRERSEAGLGRGMPAREAALARGFVLGDTEGIDAKTTEDFRRSGLSHLLAVSGENVTLLALLAIPLLGALGIGLRERLVWVLGAIAVYVPLTGAGPSIQRAGVMGAVGLLATLGGRRSSRLYGLALAALVTVAIEPAVAADVGWQLSFAAVLGILALASPLRRAIGARIGSRGARRALAEGLAVTIAATLATAPLIAFHFGTVSTTTLFANVLALPAVAPAMWLGMAGAAASQVPGAPVELLNGLDALLLAYIAQVAAWLGEPSWAEVHVRLGLGGLLASYAGLAGIVAAVPILARRRRLAGARRRSRGRVRLPRLAVAALLALAGLAALGSGGPGSAPAAAPPGLRVDVLDVGQGDAILLQPAGAPAVLVDGGPPGDGLAGKLLADGARRLGAAVITHDQSDHAAGVEELLGRYPVGRLVYARLRRGSLERARADGVATARIAAGRELRSGALRLDVLWPPPQLLAEPVPRGADPNLQALVILARWRGFRMLLTADAEAESVPVDPGPIDVLKVAHHGSDDAGLGALLDRTRPRLAVISVGAGNPYGHPTATTLATLAEHRVPTLRTDLDGDVQIDVRRDSFSVSASN
jgi:competence protein ComEC